MQSSLVQTLQLLALYLPPTLTLFFPRRESGSTGGKCVCVRVVAYRAPGRGGGGS